MANHRGAAALLLIASLLVAVALSGADARPAVRPDKTAALHGADVTMHTADNTVATVHRDANGAGDMAVAAAAAVDPDCDDNDENNNNNDEQPEQPELPGGTSHPGQPGGTSHPGQPGGTSQIPGSGGTQPDSLESELDQELCSTCEQPKKKDPPPCSTCEEPKKQPPELTCNKVRAVREGETCDSVVRCVGLGQDDFQRFNPNLCCDKLFVGQWVCIDATCAA